MCKLLPFLVASFLLSCGAAGAFGTPLAPWTPSALFLLYSAQDLGLCEEYDPDGGGLELYWQDWSYPCDWAEDDEAHCESLCACLCRRPLVHEWWQDEAISEEEGYVLSGEWLSHNLRLAIFVLQREKGYSFKASQSLQFCALAIGQHVFRKRITIASDCCIKNIVYHEICLTLHPSAQFAIMKTMKSSLYTCAYTCTYLSKHCCIS